MNKDMKSTDKVDVKTEVKADTTEKTTKEVDTGLVAKELLALRKELEALKSTQKALSDAEKTAIDEARDDMLIDDQIGPLYIDDKYKEDGYSYRIADSHRAGRIAQLQRIGYEIVEDPDFKVGQSTVGNSASLTSAVTVELGRDRGHRSGILMRIPTDKYDRRQKAKARRNAEVDAAMMNDMVSKADFGTITIGNEVYKK